MSSEVRLIDANALKTVLCASKCGVIDPASCECGCMDVMCIDDAPTIDELGKRNEPIAPEIETQNDIDVLYRCPACHKYLFYRFQKYCCICGQAVKWE